MKIVINAYSARIGGGQTYLINLLRHLPEDQSIEIEIFAPKVLILPCNKRIKRLQTFWPTTNPVLRLIWERIALPIILSRRKADVLFCPGGVVNTRPVHNCITVTMFRNMIPFDPSFIATLPIGVRRLRVALLKRAMLSSMKNSKLTIFISKYARNVIAKLIPVNQSVIIPHGISDEFRTYHRNIARPSLGFEGEYIVYVSRFDSYKHHYEVVSAYAKLPLRIRDKYKLLLVGESDMPEGKRVAELIDEKGLGNHLVVAGAISYTNLPAVYKNAALIIFASSCENCPNILLESMAAGRPVLSSSIMPMPEFGQNGVGYFDPKNPDDIADSIVRVLNDPLLIEQLSLAASERSDVYSWETTATMTWAAIADAYRSS